MAAARRSVGRARSLSAFVVVAAARRSVGRARPPPAFRVVAAACRSVGRARSPSAFVVVAAACRPTVPGGGRRFGRSAAGAFQVFDQLPRGRVPLRGVLLQAPADDRLQSGRAGRGELPQVGRCPFEHPGDGRHRCGAREGVRARGELEQQHPEGEDVGAEVDRLAADLLGRHVARRAHHRPRRGELRGRRGAGLGVAEAGQPEVDDLDAGVLDAGVPNADHVLGLQVAVKDVALVGGGEGAGDGDRGVEEVGRGQRPRRQLLPQRLARHVLADDAEGAVELLEGVDGGDAGMAQAGRGPRLAAQAPAAALVPGEPRGQRLDGDAPAEPRVLGEVHDPHAAFAELAHDPVGTEPPARRQLGPAGVPARGRVLRRGRHDLGWGRPDFRRGRPDFRPGQPDFRPGQPDFQPGQPDFRPGQPDFRPGEPDFRPGQPDFRRDRYDLRRGRHDRRGAVVVVREQRVDLGPQPRVPAAGLVQEPRAVLGVVLQRPVEQLADPPPAFRIHRPPRRRPDRRPARA